MKRISLLFFILYCTIFTSCFSSGGNPQYKKAVFNREPSEVIDDLKKMGDFEDANIKWTVSRFGESVSHNLKVYLLNGQPLANDSLRNILAKMP